MTGYYDHSIYNAVWLWLIITKGCQFNTDTYYSLHVPDTFFKVLYKYSPILYLKNHGLRKIITSILQIETPRLKKKAIA